MCVVTETHLGIFPCSPPCLTNIRVQCVDWIPTIPAQPPVLGWGEPSNRSFYCRGWLWRSPVSTAELARLQRDGNLMCRLTVLVGGCTAVCCSGRIFESNTCMFTDTGSQERWETDSICMSPQVWAWQKPTRAKEPFILERIQSDLPLHDLFS